MSDLPGRTTIVVGASRGLGRGIASAFAKAGAPVVAVARAGPALAELATTSANIRTEVADAADETVAWSLLDQYKPEVLILVAGANPVMRPIQYQSWETFSVNWHTDVKFAFSWLREALLKPLPPGSRVVVVSSGAAINGSAASGGYAGAKATQRFIAAYAQDESRRAGLDITVTAVMPGMTPFGDVGRRGIRAYAARGGQTEEEYLKQLGELLTPEMAGSALVELVRADPASSAPGTCSPPPGCRSCHENTDAGPGAHRSRAPVLIQRKETTMEIPVLHITRGTLNPKTLDEARTSHNAFVMEGPQPGIEIARSLGDLSHTVYTPAEGAGNLSDTKPGELLFIDYWADPNGMEKFFSNGFAQGPRTHERLL